MIKEQETATKKQGVIYDDILPTRSRLTYPEMSFARVSRALAGNQDVQEIQNVMFGGFFLTAHPR